MKKPTQEETQIEKLWETALDLSFATESRHIKILEKICEGQVFRLRNNKENPTKKKWGFLNVVDNIKVADNKEVDLQIQFFKTVAHALFKLRHEVEAYERAKLFLRHTVNSVQPPPQAVEICDALESAWPPLNEPIVDLEEALAKDIVNDLEGVEIIEPNIQPNPDIDKDINWIGLINSK